MEKVIIKIELTDQIAHKLESGISLVHLHELIGHDLKLGHRTKIKVLDK